MTLGFRRRNWGKMVTNKEHSDSILSISEYLVRWGNLIQTINILNWALLACYHIADHDQNTNTSILSTSFPFINPFPSNSPDSAFALKVRFGAE